MNYQVAHQLNPKEYMSPILKIFTLNPVDSKPFLEPLVIQSTGLENEEDECLLGLENPEVLPIKGEGVARPVVACDTSTIRVADLPNGSIWTLRGTIVCRMGSKRRAIIYGPVLYTLTPAQIQPIMHGLYELLGCRMSGGCSSMQIAPKIIANLFERVLQSQALEYLDGGIMLLDGSLTAGPLDSPVEAMAGLLRRAGEIGCGVLAFSKSTRLTCMGQKITEWSVAHTPPYLLRPIIKQLRYPVLGQVYVANLAPASFSFRVDASLSDGYSIAQIFSDLLASDSIIYGYPETLSLAHQLSTFSRLDLMSLRASLETMMGKRLTPEFDVRSSLFAPLDG